MKPFKTLLPILAVFGLTTALSSAAITLTQSLSVAADRTANGADTTDTVTGWDLTAGTAVANTIAVYFTAENANSFSATFAGQSMTVAQVFDGDRFVAGIAYLVNPTATVGDVVINATNSGTSRLSHAYSVVSLSGVGSVAGTDSRISNGDLSYTTIADGGYVLGVAVNNSFDGGTLPSVSGNPDVNLFQQAVDGNASMLHAHGDVATAGLYSDTYTGSIEGAATVAFNPIPEPTTALLGGLGMLCLLRRRRA